MPLQTADDLKEGDVLAGKYRVERVIGVGGMGVVAAALHLELGTVVAIKLLLSAATAPDEAIERFSREARAASRLRGEHAVRVFDVGKHSDGTPYMVMEYLVGEDLDTMVSAKGALEPSTAVGFVLQACEAVAEAHSIGIIHRDLKPTNLFLTRRIDGSLLVKVLDFGIAKRVEAENGVSLTGTLLVGSPPYMSPEQMRASAELDARTDIWSLGICLYELMTGVLPFTGNSALETCASVQKDIPRPAAALRPDIPADLSDVVMRCLRKDPAQRFRDVVALAEALEPFAPASYRGYALRIRRVLGSQVASDGTDARPPAADRDAPTEVISARKTHWRGRLFLGIAAVIALAAALAVWKRPRARGEPVAALAAAPPVQVSGGVTLLPPPPVAEQASTPPPERTDPAPPGGTPAKRPKSPSAAPAGGVHPIVSTLAVPAPSEGSAPEPLVPLPAPPLPSSPAAAVSPATVASAPSVPPRFAIASAHVQIGSPTGVVGSTAINFSRALAKLGPRMTACYREALPRMSAPFDGTASLHVETDEDGVIVGAQMAGPLAAGVGPCIATAVRGVTIPSVDTGRAHADVPLVFTAR
jgi:hypothetical protein